MQADGLVFREPNRLSRNSQPSPVELAAFMSGVDAVDGSSNDDLTSACDAVDGSSTGIATSGNGTFATFAAMLLTSGLPCKRKYRGSARFVGKVRPAGKISENLIPAF